SVPSPAVPSTKAHWMWQKHKPCATDSNKMKALERGLFYVMISAAPNTGVRRNHHSQPARNLRSAAAWVKQTLCRHGWRRGAYRDVLAACLRNPCPSDGGPDVGNTKLHPTHGATHHEQHQTHHPLPGY